MSHVSITLEQQMISQIANVSYDSATVMLAPLDFNSVLV